MIPAANERAVLQDPLTALANLAETDQQHFELGGLVWRLATTLPSSLDVDEVVRIFDKELRRILPFDALVYARPDSDPLPAEPGGHLCRYDLNLMNRSLGELQVRRQRPFSGAEIELLESALCALMYPLRNALLYEQALATALKDPVTGVNNRSALNNYLGQKISECARHGSIMSVIMFDIDWFKSINDRFGHIAGDGVLASVAAQMTDCTRTSDSVFRYGGEEFAVVLSNTPLEGARLLADRIRRRVEEKTFPLGDSSSPITISAGVAEFRAGDSAVTLIARADERLYAAKSAGRNRVM